ncbi:hypothetical protein OG756_22690 [Streptomyces sp. NBC_01310]|uniref:hypothetical protein n=1 Tax=Streptomyces sp. NBC_01310 TaxID=2903820 RepID=UPI0035B63511|nr:hypothetical protein OG756_22690 [Streptomyces sp. NBC_01310]
MISEEKQPKRPATQTSWQNGTAMVLGAAAMLIGAVLLLVPVRTADAAARAFAAADTCAPGLPPRERAQCLSPEPATVERYGQDERGDTYTYVEVVLGDGRTRHLDLQGSGFRMVPAQGDPVRLVSWRGEVRYVVYGSGAPRTAVTDANPHTTYAVPFGWGAFLLLFGPVLIWIGSWQRWLSHRSRRAAPWQVMVPCVTLSLLSVGVLIAAMVSDLPIGQLLRVCGAGLALAAVVIGAVWIYKALRGESDTAEVEPRRDDREHVFIAHVLGDDTGFGPGPYLVVAPGVLAFSVDPTGAFRRAPLPSGLVLEQVRPVFASDPGAMELYGRYEPTYLVAQCRDGEREVLIAVPRKKMPWLVGALPKAERAAAPG